MGNTRVLPLSGWGVRVGSGLPGRRFALPWADESRGPWRETRQAPPARMCGVTVAKRNYTTISLYIEPLAFSAQHPLSGEPCTQKRSSGTCPAVYIWWPPVPGARLATAPDSKAPGKLGWYAG